MLRFGFILLNRNSHVFSCVANCFWEECFICSTKASSALWSLPFSSKSLFFLKAIYCSAHVELGRGFKSWPRLLWIMLKDLTLFSCTSPSLSPVFLSSMFWCAWLVFLYFKQLWVISDYIHVQIRSKWCHNC